MLPLCLVCLALSTPVHVPTDGPIARAARVAFTEQALTDGERIRLRRALDAAEQSAAARRLNHATWTFVATAAADWSVYAACVHDRCGEKTQTGLFLHGVRREAAIPIGLAIDAALAVGLRKFVGEDYPRLAEIALYVLSGARVVVLTDRIHDLRKD